MQRSIVDLLDPEPPMIATTSPSQARKLTPLSTSVDPNALRSPSMPIASDRSDLTVVSEGAASVTAPAV